MFILSNVQNLSPNLHAWIEEKQIEINQHLAWHGLLTEQEAESLLKNQIPYTYLLRGTEHPEQFYLSFLQTDLAPAHRIFVMQNASLSWFYLNYDPHHAASLQDLIPQMMHCSEKECRPLIRQHMN